jgi:tetratricopeptide (TPR) repeat protein
VSPDPVELGAENDERLVRLREALALGDGFQLIIAEVATAALVPEIVARMESWSGRDGCPPLHVVRLAEGESAIERLRSSGPGGVILLGLSPASEDADPIVELNWYRDLLPSLIDGPLVLVASTDELRALFERAPDLYSWRRHSVQFDVTRGGEDHQPFFPWPFYQRILDSLDLVDSRARIPQSVDRDRLLALVGLRLEIDGDHDVAESWFDEAKRSLKRSGAYTDRVTRALVRAAGAVARGVFAEASQELDGATRLVSQGDDLGPLRGFAFAFGLAFVRAELAYAAGEVARAEALFLGIAGAQYTKTQIASALLPLGAIAAQRHDDVVARERLERARMLFAEADDLQGQAWVLDQLAVIASRHGRHHEARDHRDAAVELAEQLSDSDLMIDTLTKLGLGCLAINDLAGAHGALAGAASHLDPDVEPRLRAQLALARGRLALAEQDPGAAAACLREAVAAFSDRPSQAARAALVLGECELRRNAWEAAREAYGTAERLAEQSWDREAPALARLGQARARIEGGQMNEVSVGLLEQAADGFAELRQHVREAVARTELGRVLIALGRFGDAIAHLERAVARYRAAGLPVREDEAAALLTQARASRHQ